MDEQIKLMSAISLSDTDTSFIHLVKQLPAVMVRFTQADNGLIHILDVSSEASDMFGVSEELFRNEPFCLWQCIHSLDQDFCKKALAESAQTLSTIHNVWRFWHPEKGERQIICHASPELDENHNVVWHGYFQDITELKWGEQKNLAYIRFLESIDTVNQIIQGADNLEQMMQDVLDALLTILGCDRAWLVSPCDPTAKTMRVQMERTRPEYPGGAQADVEYPISPGVAESMRLCLASDGPIVMGPGSDHALPDLAEKVNVQSFLAMALYPKVGTPWTFGLHQCAYPRIWSEDDKYLFNEIGHRLSDSLTSLLISQNLQQSEARFRQAFEFAGIGMGILSTEGQWLRANHSICDMLGYSEDELKQLTYQDLTHPEDLVKGKEDVLRLLADEIPFIQIEKRYQHRDGHYLWARLTTSIVRDENNQPLYFVSQIENIEQGMRNEEALTLLNFAINRVQESVYLIDENARFKYINHEVCEQLGYSQAELLNQMSVPDIDPDYQIAPWKELWEQTKDGKLRVLETRHKRKNGEIVPVEVSVFYFEYNKCPYQLALVRNIAERKRAERELSLLSLAVNQVSECVYLIAENAQIKYVNDEVSRELGYSRDELLQMTIPEIDPDYQIDRWHTHWQELKKAHSIRLESRHKLKDGRIIPVEVNANYFEYDGVGYNLALIHNISERKRAEQELSLLNFSLNHISESIYLVADNSCFSYVNNAACEELGYSRDELLQMRVKDIDPDFPEPADWQAFWDQLRNKRVVTFEATHRTKTNKLIPVEITANYLEYNGDVYSLAFSRNISERKHIEAAQQAAEQTIREQEERLRQLAENIEEVAWLRDVDKQQLLYVSPAYEKIWGRSRDELYTDSRAWMKYIHPDDKARVEEVYNRARDTGTGGYTVEFWLVRPDGELRYILVHGFPVLDDAGRLYRVAGTARDLTERKEHESRIQHIAYHDDLTDLPNRTAVMERLELELVKSTRHQQMLAVLFLDLDRFKTINDTLGHHAGDQLLILVGERIQTVLRAGDMVGRLGGDEFIVLLPYLTEPEEAAHVADKLISTISEPFVISDRELHLTTSIGISLYPKDTDDAETLVKYADMALYHAKEHGRATYRYFSPALDVKVHERLRLEHDLHTALNHDQFYLNYQPLMHIESGQCIGVEVLLRWTHPEHGFISPADFIPVAEETGLIVPLGSWVLRNACQQAKAWFDAGNIDFRVSVNLSRRQLDYAGLVEDVQLILDETGCPAHMLELEVTESSAMQNPEQAIAILNKLHDMGICLALDDYGTGYSSLSYLKRFPFDRLKIDRSFVDGIPDDSDDVVIVQTTIILANQLGLEVIAEGVETPEQKAFLQANGCPELQGYLFARPMSKEALEAQFDFLT